MSKYLISIPLFGLLLFTGCSQKQTKVNYSHNKIPTYSQYNYDIAVPKAEYTFSNEKLASMIKELEGSPYVWAEEGPNQFDCSGYLYYMFGKMGMQIPRVAREQIKYGTPVDMTNLKFGDFVFFNTTKKRSEAITHVGIYLKDGWFSHASSVSGKTTYANLFTNKYYNDRFKGARRYVAENSYSAFEPRLNLYAIDATNQVNEVTSYVDNNKITKKNVTTLARLESTKKAKNGHHLVSIDNSILRGKRTVNKIENPHNLVSSNVSVLPVTTVAPQATVVAMNNIAPLPPHVENNIMQVNNTPQAPIVNGTLLQANNTTVEIENSIQIADSRPKEPTVVLEQPIKKIEPKVEVVKIVNTKTPKIKIAEKLTPFTTKISYVKAITPAKSHSNGYYVQLGKFKNRPNSDLLKKITKNGFAYTLMPSQNSDDKLSKLLIGPFKSKKDAGDTLNSVKAKIEQEAFITKVDS